MPLSTSGDVDGVFKPFRVVTPSLRLLILLSGSSAVLLLAWFLFALLPSRKAGVGIFVLPESIVTLYSPGQGYVYFSPQIKDKILESNAIYQILNSEWDMAMQKYLQKRSQESSAYRFIEQYNSYRPLLAPLQDKYANTSTAQNSDLTQNSYTNPPVCQEPNKPFHFCSITIQGPNYLTP